ncbi:MAG: ATP-binding cassette domain-containing protein, partial [Pseudomonadota bacterium]
MELRLAGVSHRYGTTEVLSGIDLAVPDGRVTCLVGPSGCGKSTLLRFLGGLERPAEGRVEQAGEAPE